MNLRSIALPIFATISFLVGVNAYAIVANKTEWIAIYHVPKTFLKKQSWFSADFSFPEDFGHKASIPVFLKLQTVIGTIAGPFKYRWHESQVHVPIRLPSGKDGYYIPYVRTDSLIMKSFFSFWFENQVISGDRFIGFEKQINRFEDRSPENKSMVNAKIEIEKSIATPISKERPFIERWLNQDIIALDDRKNTYCIPVQYDIESAVRLPILKMDVVLSDEFTNVLGQRNRNQTLLQSSLENDQMAGAFVWNASAHMGIASPCR